MSEINNKYFECPECGCAMAFELNYDKNKYVSTCPFCKNELEIEKEEFEREGEVIREIYFQEDF